MPNEALEPRKKTSSVSPMQVIAAPGSRLRGEARGQQEAASGGRGRLADAHGWLVERDGGGEEDGLERDSEEGADAEVEVVEGGLELVVARRPAEGESRQRPASRARGAVKMGGEAHCGLDALE